MKKKLFAIIGSPITHSLSPVLHNYWFEKYNIEAEYSLLDVREENLKNVIQKIKNEELSGINVTLPYKKKIIPFLDRLINDAEHTSSVNTIFLNDENLIIGENTDVFGLQAAYLKQINNAKSKNALVIGAGGVSPSVIFSLAKSKFKKISIINRTHEKSLFLKKKFSFLNVLEWKSLKQELVKFDVIVNATSLGLKGGLDFEFNFENVKSDAIFIDTIYNPLETKTIRYLRDNKIKAFNGLEMFIYQGQKSFYLWNKINPEIDDRLLDLLISKLK